MIESDKFMSLVRIGKRRRSFFRRFSIKTIFFQQLNLWIGHTCFVFDSIDEIDKLGDAIKEIARHLKGKEDDT